MYIVEHDEINNSYLSGARPMRDGYTYYGGSALFKRELLIVLLGF